MSKLIGQKIKYKQAVETGTISNPVKMEDREGLVIDSFLNSSDKVTLVVQSSEGDLLELSIQETHGIVATKEKKIKDEPLKEPVE